MHPGAIFPRSHTHFFNAHSLHVNLLLHKLPKITRPKLAVFRARICVRRNCPTYFIHHLANAPADAGERKRTHTHMHANARTRTHGGFGCFACMKTDSDIICVLSIANFRVLTQNVGSKTFRMHYRYCTSVCIIISFILCV